MFAIILIMTSENQTPPNEQVQLNRNEVFRIAASSAEELHPDFAAMDQLDSLPSTDESRRTEPVVEKQHYDIANQPEAIDSDPTSAYGIERKIIPPMPTSILGEIAFRAMYGNRAGTRAHNETPRDAKERSAREKLSNRRQKALDNFSIQAADLKPEDLGPVSLDHPDRKDKL